MLTVPQHRLFRAAVAPSVIAILILITAVPLLADEPSGAAGALAMGAAFLFIAVVGIVFYIYFALALQTIAKKTNTENDWWAWIPIIQIVLMLNIAKKPVWWIILFFVPFVGIVFAILVFMAIAEARNKPNWWGILVIVPVIGLIVPGYLAWSD
jgi:hypothetical protein